MHKQAHIQKAPWKNQSYLKVAIFQSPTVQGIINVRTTGRVHTADIKVAKVGPFL